MILNRVPFHASRVLRIGTRMATTFVGKSGRVYKQREVLQERNDPRLNIFKAEYVLGTSHFEVRSTTIDLDIRTGLLSSNACPDHSTTSHCAWPRISPSLVGFAYMLIPTRTEISWFIRTTNIPCLDCFKRTRTSLMLHGRKSCGRREKPYKNYIARTGSISVR
jgi:hypothetical protein